jgi:hypothetical protein
MTESRKVMPASRACSALTKAKIRVKSKKTSTERKALPMKKLFSVNRNVVEYDMQSRTAIRTVTDL